MFFRSPPPAFAQLPLQHAARLLRGVALTLAASLAATSALAQAPAAITGDGASSAVSVATQDAGPTVNSRELHEFIDGVVRRHGLDRAYVTYALSRARYSPQIARLILPPPSPTAKNWRAYRARFVEPVRIQAGLRFWRQHEDLLRRAEAQYGVPAEIIVAIIGVETLFGRDMGSFRVLDAMYTLAFNYPETWNRASRTALFREQFEDFLVWCKEHDEEPTAVLGSFAGAVGLPQFMPTSLRRFAVDFDGDGRVNVRGSTADAIGSVANFLKQHGWETGRPVVWAIARDPGSQGIAEAAADGQPEPKRKLHELLRAGMRLADTVDTQAEGDTSVLVVDLPVLDQYTEYVVGLRNFYVLTRYNRSFFYALAVHDLARAVRAKRPS